MSDAGGTGSGGDKPGFDWLYGKQGGSTPPPPPPPPARGAPKHPEQTVRMPVQQPPSDQGPVGQQPYAQRPSARPTPPPVAPPPPSPGVGSSSGGRSGWTRPGRWVKIVAALVVLWIVYLIAVPLWTWHKVDKVAFEPSGDRPDDQPGTTYLIVGSDSRGDLTAEQRKQYGTGDASGQRTDTIMLLHTGSGPNLLVSIPRDTRVTVPGHGENQLINSAYAYGGPKLLTQTIEQTTGIRIDRYVEIGFGGFVDIVDAVGGITICPKQDIKDPKAKLDVKKGCQHADGPTALGYARTRATINSDFDRVQRQREVVGEIGSKVATPWSVINPIRYWKINEAAPGAVAVGDGMNALEAMEFASAMTKTTGDSGRTCTLPSRYEDIDGNGINDVLIDHARADKLFDLIKEDKTDDVTNAVCDQKGVG